MDKKILLGGAAALIMGLGMFANPASAAIEISHSGEAKLTAVMSDACSKSAANLDDNAAYTHASAATAAVSKGACTGTEEAPLWSTSSKLDWSAGGTLANGLSVSTSQDADINLSGAFGSVTFKNGGDSAIAASKVFNQGDITVAGDYDIGGHSVSTAGTSGTVVTYAAPSMGGMNLFVSYAPNSARDDTAASPLTTDDSPFTDTIGLGASFGMDALTISAGWESATQNDSATGACTPLAAAGDKTAAVTSANGAAAEADTVSGGTVCGDQTLTAFGAVMSVSDISLNAGYSKLDSQEADVTVMNLGAGMAVGEYNLTLDYVDSKKQYLDAAIADDQTVIQVGASTSLGDGVTLGLKFANNQYNLAGTGAHTNYRAAAELKVAY
jgi:hypothetical protein